MHQRVACLRCSAHRDLTLSARCLVCGFEASAPVPLNLHDVEQQIGDACELLMDLLELRAELTADVDGLTH
jgi:hypothetical protein